ncbi:MAG: AAA family ATPase [Candidatus Zixiibacteriota bacterium]
MRFKDVINQDMVKQVLVRTVDRDQLPNSFLFSGPEGSGKWAAALALTAYINCRQPHDGDSCGECPPCRQVQKLQFQNLFIAIPTPPSKSEKEEFDNYWEILNGKIEEPYGLITGERQMSIPVATVRQMKKSLSQKAPELGRRVVLIEQMDRMLTSSADALLKLIEEPPARTLIIITTSRPEKLLPTIISRCREIHFGHLDNESIAKYLVGHTECNEKQAQVFSRLCQGSLGRALYLTSGDNSQDREVAKMLFKGFFLTDTGALIAEAGDLLPFKDRFRINRIIGHWQSLFRDIIVLKNSAGNDNVINIDFISELERMASMPLPLNPLLQIPGYLNSVMHDIELNVETQIAIGALIAEVRQRLQLTASSR